MDELLSDLYAFAEEHLDIPMNAKHRSCLHLQDRHMEAVRAQMGGDFADKLSDTLLECSCAEEEAAFRRGLRLGLILQRL